MMRIEAKRNATASQGLLSCFQHLLHALSLQAVVLFAILLVSATASQAQGDPAGEGASFFVGSNQRGEGGSPLAVRGFANQRTEVFFYYNSPEDGIPGPEQNDHLQGFSMVFCYDCRLNCIEESFRIPPEAITSVISADFVEFQCDNDPGDGDGCEMLLAVLIETMPPFRGDTLPPTSQPLMVGSVQFEVDSRVNCGDELPIEFCDGVNVRGRVPLQNVYSAANQSLVARTINSGVVIDSGRLFQRGDCNSDNRVTISDPISVLMATILAQEFDFEPRCEDACDGNDDGVLDIGDAVYLLGWMFRSGLLPPAPGPYIFGLDPTEDALECTMPCE
tara:strand:- start:97 stop:1098 length:1002 start_codon:yes stop_codon:yes gene_type:complete